MNSWSATKVPHRQGETSGYTVTPSLRRLQQMNPGKLGIQFVQCLVVGARLIKLHKCMGYILNLTF